MVPGLSYALTAYAILSFANDPSGALAGELGCSRETAQALLDGQAVIRLDALWNPGRKVDTAQLADGSSLSVGDHVYVWAREPVLGLRQGRLLWAKHIRIIELKLTGTPGKVRVLLDDETELGMPMEVDRYHEAPDDVVQSAREYD
jgi:hypothetical protein